MPTAISNVLRRCTGPRIWLLLFALHATTALATTARVAALGGGAFIEDDHNVQRWYGSLGDYPALLVLETGHFSLAEGWHDSRGQRISGPGVGAHLPLDSSGRWGTAALFYNDRGDDGDPGGLARGYLGPTWTGMWSRAFGPWQPTLVFRRSTLDESETVGGSAANPVIRNRRGSRTDLGIGLRRELGEAAYLDLAGEWRRHRERISVTDGVATVTGAERESRGALGLRGRAFIRLGEATALVPTLEYLNDERVLPTLAPTRAADLSGDLVKLGTGLNWYPDSDHFLVAGLDWLHARTNTNDRAAGTVGGEWTRREWNSLSATLGFESRFRYWLTFRGSLRYEPVNFGDATDTGEADFATFMVNFGAAVQLDKYDLDLAVTDQEPGGVSGYWGHSLSGTSTTWVTATLRRLF